MVYARFSVGESGGAGGIGKKRAFKSQSGTPWECTSIFTDASLERDMEAVGQEDRIWCMPTCFQVWFNL